MKPERPAVDFASHRAWPKVPPKGVAEMILEAPRKVDDKLDVLAPSGSYGAYHDDRGHQRCHTGHPQYAACRSVLPHVGI